jgi:hypothetical protein
MNHLTIEELDYRLDEITKFKKNCFIQLDDNQKKLYEKNKYSCDVFLETIQHQNNKQKVNKANCVTEKKDSDRDVLIVSVGLLIIGLISYFLTENSISLAFLFLFIGIYSVWRINEKNFQSSCEFMIIQNSESSIEHCVLQANLLGVDSFTIKSATKLQENIDNSYDFIGNKVKNTDEQIVKWNCELLIKKLQIELLVMSKINDTLQVKNYTSSSYFRNEIKITDLG